MLKMQAKGVEVNVDLKNSTIKSVICLDCVASQGGCKHGLAVLAWLHRKSEDKGVTEIKAYWKRSKLSRVGTTLKYIEAKSLAPKYLSQSKNNQQMHFKKSPEGSFLKEVCESVHNYHLESPSTTQKFALFYHVTEETTWYEELDIHTLAISLKKLGKKDANDFLDFCRSKMTEELCSKAQAFTIQQSQNQLWFKLR